MELEEDENSFDQDSIIPYWKEKNTTVIISSHNDDVHIHLDNYNSERGNTSEEELKVDLEEFKKNENWIIDIQQITKSLTLNQIRKASLELIPSYKSFIQPSEQQYHEKEDDLMEVDDNCIEQIDSYCGLFDRKKGEKLSNKQLNFLKQQWNESKLTTKQLSSKYFVSPSLITKIKRMSNNQINNENSIQYEKLYGKDKEDLVMQIKNFINQTKYAFNANEATKYVNSVLKREYKTSQIRKIMKCEMNLTYKKIKPRPNNVDLSMVNAKRQLFAIKFANFIEKDTLLINIDETWINRQIKNAYSWGLRGKQTEAKNSPFIGSINWIMAILWNGSWIWMLTNESINSIKFLSFLSSLSNWLKNNKDFNYNKTLTILDNWSIHKWNNVKQMLSKINTKVMYLPAYTPQFAPIEMWFAMLKNNLRRICSQELVRLNKKESYNKVYRSMKLIKAENIRNLLKNMYSEISKYI